MAGRDDFDLHALKQPVFHSYERLERALQAKADELEARRADLRERREATHRRREELITLRVELEHQHAAALKSSYGVFACCYAQPNTTAVEVDARRERRKEVANTAMAAFEDADIDDDRELTVDELRRIEGDNAELVMREADVNGDGTLSKREYVNYKLRIAKEAGKAARRAFKTADFNDDRELTVHELRAIEGDNAERVMREADVDGGGTLSKREYVDYKMRVAARGFLQQ